MIVRVAVVGLFPNMFHVQGKADDQDTRYRSGTVMCSTSVGARDS